MPSDSSPPTKPQRKKTSVGKRLLLLTVTLLISVVLAEMAYRVLQPKPYATAEIVTMGGRRVPNSEIAHFLRTSNDGAVARHPRGTLKPGLQLKQWYDRPTQPEFDADGCVTVTFNDLGFRDLPFEVEKQPDEFRILAVGDSFTFGSGVQDADTWPQQLEGLLRTERTSHVEVINAGFATGSYHVAGYVDWIRSDGADFNPDVLVIGLCLNDLGDIPMLGYLVVKPEQPWLGGVSEILNTIQGKMLMDEVKQQKQDDTLLLKYETAMAIANNREVSWPAAQEGFRSIKKIAADRGMRLIVAVFPMVTQLNERYPLVHTHATVGKFLKTEGIESVDLLDNFMGREESDLWVHPTDQHPNKIGQALIAEGIRDYLNANPNEPK
jgi:lysophospholipase L1-like esterase